jgi:hypothetical protein
LLGSIKQALYNTHAANIYKKLIEAMPIIEQSTAPFADNGMLKFAAAQREEADRCIAVTRALQSDVTGDAATVNALIEKAVDATGLNFDADTVKHSVGQIISIVYEKPLLLIDAWCANVFATLDNASFVKFDDDSFDNEVEKIRLAVVSVRKACIFVDLTIAKDALQTAKDAKATIVALTKE